MSKEKEIPSESPSNALVIIITIAIMIGVIFCLHAVSTREMTNSETTLYSLLLTLLSVFAGWLVTHVYAKQQNTMSIQAIKEGEHENLRTFALKAAEKVDNLSKQIEGVASYLEDELEYEDYKSEGDALHSREERIESAIHMIRMLKSTNDTSISDWNGIIGRELDEKREEQLQHENKISELSDKIDMLFHSQEDQSSARTTEIDRRMSELQTELRFFLRASGAPISSVKKLKAPKETFLKVCPTCGNEINYTQRLIEGSVKTFRCKLCGEKLVSFYRKGEGLVLEKQQLKEEPFRCPSCGENQKIIISNRPASSLTHSCSKCSARLKITRTSIGLDIDQIGASVSDGHEVVNLNDDIIEQVEKMLPVQPWPIGIHKSIASKLGISQAAAHAAIEELINRGKAHMQFKGKLYHQMSDDGSKPDMLSGESNSPITS